MFCGAATDAGIRIGRGPWPVQAEQARTASMIPTAADVRRHPKFQARAAFVTYQPPRPHCGSPLREGIPAPNTRRPKDRDPSASWCFCGAATDVRPRITRGIVHVQAEQARTATMTISAADERNVSGIAPTFPKVIGKHS